MARIGFASYHQPKPLKFYNVAAILSANRLPVEHTMVCSISWRSKFYYWMFILRFAYDDKRLSEIIAGRSSLLRSQSNPEAPIELILGLYLIYSTVFVRLFWWLVLVELRYQAPWDFPSFDRKRKGRANSSIVEGEVSSRPTTFRAWFWITVTNFILRYRRFREEDI